MNKNLRPLCNQCKTRPRAYAYKRYNKIYWRSLCDRCNRIKADKKVADSGSKATKVETEPKVDYKN